ncbi:MAG: hypothetical protein AB7U20_08675 [Planctomycetaceae bacterium]
MTDDPVIREIRAYRDTLADRFRDDPEGFYKWLKECEERSRQQERSFTVCSPKRLQPASTHHDN